MQSIASILSLPEVTRGDPEILLGADSLAQPVRWVHVAGTQNLTGLLTGGELVLATAAIAAPSAVAARHFLEVLASEGAVALFVEDPVPEQLTIQYDDAAHFLREAATAVGVSFPVVRLRRALRFVEITQSVHRMIVAEQLAQVERARHLHEEFVSLSVNGASQEEIVAAAARLVGAPVVLEDRQHRVLSWSAESDAALEPWTQHESLEDVAAERGWVHVEVGVGGHAWGHLVIPFNDAPHPDMDTDDAWRTDARLVLERAAQALTINRLAGRDERAIVQRARSTFFEDAANASTNSSTNSSAHGSEHRPALGAGPSAVRRRELNVRAQALGLGSAQRYVPGVVVLKNKYPHGAGRQNQEIELIEHLYRSAAAARIPLLAASTAGGNVGMVVGLQQASPSADWREAEDAALNALLKELDPAGVAVGVAPSVIEAVDAAASIGAATRMAQTAATLADPDRPFYRTQDLRLHGLLSQFSTDDRLENFIEAELGPLLHPVDESALDLLGSFVRAGGNRSVVAREQFLSRPAVYARLERLEKRLGVSLDDAESRASLHIALLAREVRGGRTSR